MVFVFILLGMFIGIGIAYYLMNKAFSSLSSEFFGW